MERIGAALAAAGLGEKRLLPADLAPLDQFHAGGLAATAEFAAMLKITPETHVLDLGSGLGGPSRYLAETFGCRVQGIDLSESYVEAANYLAEKAGLSDKVQYDNANALALPYVAETYDLVWTQHVAMNIADRAGLYAEAFRVLKSGGKLAIYDVVAGDGSRLAFPVPWAQGPEGSFLFTPEEMRASLERQGFHSVSSVDHTEEGIRWFAELQRSLASGGGTPPPLGLHLILGPNFREMAANFGRNLTEGRIGLAQVVAQKPSGA